MGVLIPSLQSGLLNQPSAQVIDGSLKFNDDSSNVLNRTPSAAGNRKTWTWSGWVKRTTLGTEGGIFSTYAGAHPNTSLFWESEALKFHDYTGSYNIRLGTSAVFRDPSAWYHIVLAYNSTESTASDRAKLYVNGTLQTLSGTTVPSNFETDWNSTTEHNIGRFAAYFDGSMSQCYFIDGQALGPGYFGFTDPLTETWRPRKFRAVGTTVNDGTVWSSYLTTSSGSIQNIANAFDGNTTTYNNSTANDVVFTFTPPTPIRYKNSVRIWLRTADHKARINGGTYIFNTGAPLAGQWMTLATGSGLINTIDVQYTANSLTAINAIEVDGVTMIDSTTTNLDFGTNGFYLPMNGNSSIGEDKSGKGNNWTPTNFGGSVALDNPIVSGARPILNTGTGGTVARPGVFGSEVGAYYAVTVASVGGGNRYHFDGVDRPNPTLIRGATYTFDQSDSSNSSHPLRFATAADAAGSSQYTDGVVTNGTPGSAGAYTKITVPHNSPNTLHYYCTNHGGMGSSTSQITDETKADPYAWKNVISLPLVGANSDVSNSVNSGSTTKVMTSVGNAAASSDTSNFYNGSFEFDGSGDYLSTSDNSDFAFGTGDFTVEVWYNPDDIADYRTIIDSRDGGVNSNNGWILGQRGNGKIYVYSNSVFLLESTSLPKVGEWTHIAFVRSGSTSTLYINGIAEATSTTSKNYTDDRWRVAAESYDGQGGSFMFNGYISDARAYKGVAKYTSNFVVPATSPDILPDTPSGVSGSSKLAKVTDGAVSVLGTATSKLTLADSSDFTFGTNSFDIEFYYYNDSLDGTYNILFDCMGSNRSGIQISINTSNNYQIEVGDGSSNWIWQNTSFPAKARKWTHFALTRDSNTFRVFEDGILLGTQTSSTSVGDPRSPAIGGYASDDSTNYGFNGFISNFRIVNGSSVYTVAFIPPTAPLTDVTNTKLLCCQSPTSATEGAVKPGTITAAGNAASTNFNPFNTDINTVRGQETDYCTINPLDGYVSTKDGNLETSTSSGWQSIRATLGMNSGKFYWETQNNQDASAILGIADSEATGFVDGSIFGSTGHGGGDANPAYTWAGANYYFNATTAGTGLSNHVPSDVVQYAFDADSGKLWFGRNGVWYSSSWGTTGNPAGGSNATVSGINTTKTYLACASFYNGSGKFNFGQKPFKFPPPDGFSPLNAANVLPETVITRPDKYVGATIWDGTGSARSIDIGTQPDLVWVKVRNHTYYHYLVDSVRGAGKELNSNTTDDEYTDTSNISAFNANGFSLGTGAGVNQSGGKNYVAWCWKAGGNKNTFNVDDVGYASAAAAGLDGGNINPNRASVGTKQGFSIIRYTGTDATSNTFSHGLTQKPDFAIFKNTSQDGDDWIVYHSSIGATKRLKLNSSNAADSQTSQFNDTEPTSSVFTIGTYDNINKLNNNYISYIWHNVPGLQKFGSVETVSDVGYAEIGFRPALVIFKNIDASSSWSIRDNKRVPYNPNDILLRADTAGEDFTSSGKVDFLSNGFKIQGSGFGSYTYIYAAWAEAPAFNLYGAQSNAR